MLQLAGHLVQGQEVLEVAPLALVQRPPGVHALDDGRHVTEHHGVHERCIVRAAATTGRRGTTHVNNKHTTSVTGLATTTSTPRRRWRVRLTSDQHRDDAENLLRAGRGRHVAEPHAGQTRTREVQRGYVRLRVRHVVHVHV